MVKSIGKLVAAAILYTAFTAYLYLPYFRHFRRLEFLAVLNLPLAAMGTLLLSRRWVWAFTASFFAGAIYAFGPFFLSFSSYHPFAGFLAAIIPWLFIPAAIWKKHKWLSFPLLALPILAIISFFLLTAQLHLFTVPIQTRFHPADLIGILIPLAAADADLNLIGFYHVPIAPLLLGISMLIAGKRFAIILFSLAGFVLAFCHSFLTIAPLAWLTLPALGGSVMIAIGMQGLASAGPADKKYLLTTTSTMTILAIATLLAGLTGTTFLNMQSVSFLQSAQMYLLGTIAAAILFFFSRAKLHKRTVCWIVFTAAVAIDICISTSLIIDKIF
ncbi:MAG: hypothetical protein ACYST9_01355 [Planctomycetota bacterium]|jgi:hypothetical protein